MVCVKYTASIKIFNHTNIRFNRITGKTSICDFLISTNGVISTESAGKVQFLDSREDEHRRCITMKSSCISLYYKSSDFPESYLINLVDCPGHVDFSCDVRTFVQFLDIIYSTLIQVESMVHICDGVLLIIDVVEGIRSQTKHVAEKAYKECLQFVLVFNKSEYILVFSTLLLFHNFILNKSL
jgi:translation elongation factor EF-G